MSLFIPVRPVFSILVCTAALLASTFFAGAAELTPDQRAALLAQMQAERDKQPCAHAHFRETKQSHLMKDPLVSEGNIAFCAPNQFRREIAGDNRSLTISDGKTLWIYYPNFQEAEKYPLGQRALFDQTISAITAGMNFTHIEDYYKLAVYDEGADYRFVLLPRKGNLKRLMNQLTIWLDKKLLLQKTELLMPAGDKTITEYTGTERSALPASTFSFTPPEGTRVTTPLGK